jgi:hypothetical protein
MEFKLEEAFNAANEALLLKRHKRLTDVEVIIFEGAWRNQTYDEIAAKNPHYGSSYISRDAAPALWHQLSEALGETVKKNNFKEALKRWREKKSASGQISLTQNISANQSPPKEVDKFSPPDSYVERPIIESRCYDTLLLPGSLLRIKALRQMGKTSLINRVLAKLENQGYRTANLSLYLADKSTHFTNLDKFLRWFCNRVSRELQLPNQLDDYWDEEDAGSKGNCTTYFEEYLLPEADSPLVLCLDDVDLIFPHPEIYQDFFDLLRFWHERAKSRPLWKKLRLVVVHSTEAYIPLNINQSPFNVGVPIELLEFSPEEVLNFAKQHGLDWDAAKVEQVMKLVGGHPELLQQAFSHFKSCQNLTLEQFLTMAPTEAGIYGNHLRQHLWDLRKETGLAVAFKTVVTATASVQLDPMQTYKLHRMGLVQLQGNEVKPRCNLYSQYFCDRLRDV